MFSNFARRVLALGMVATLPLVLTSCSVDSGLSPDNSSTAGTAAHGGEQGADGVWRTMDSGTGEWLWGVWGTPAADVFVVGNGGTALHLRNDVWVPEATPTVEDFCDVWSNDHGKALAVGLGGAAAFWDGNSWAAVQPANASNLFDVYGCESDAANSLKFVPPGTVSRATLAAPGLEAIAVGEAGRINLFDGTGLLDLPSPTDVSLFGLWAATRSNLYAVGVGGTIIEFRDEMWVFHDSPALENLSGVWGAAADDIWAVGDLGTLLHFDGMAWTMVPVGVSNNLFGVWGTSGSNVFVVGGGGVILHFDGTAWTQMDSPTNRDLFKVWGRSVNEVYAVGQDGTILRFGPQDGGNGDECPTIEEAWRTIGEIVDERCPLPELYDWESFEDYVKCVKHTVIEILDSDEYRDCFDKKDRKRIIKCVLLPRCGDHGDDDGDDCPTLDDACEWVGAQVDELCPPDGDWKNHGEYVSCVARTATDILRDEEWKDFCDREERDNIHGCVVSRRAQSDVGKGDADNGSDRDDDEGDGRGDRHDD